jgi:hypothetical protein
MAKLKGSLDSLKKANVKLNQQLQVKAATESKKTDSLLALVKTVQKTQSEQAKTTEKPVVVVKKDSIPNAPVKKDVAIAVKKDSASIHVAIKKDSSGTKAVKVAVQPKDSSKTKLVKAVVQPQTVQQQVKDSSATKIVKVAVQPKPQALVPHMTSGRFFNEPTTDENHCLTVKELSDVFDTIIKGNVCTTRWYTLSDGFNIQILHPIEWLKLVMEAYASIDNTITDTKKFIEAINASDTAVSNESMSPTRNYYWGPDGKIAFIDDYKWSSHKNLPVITYKGYPVIKGTCGNAQLPIVPISKNASTAKF